MQAEAALDAFIGELPDIRIVQRTGIFSHETEIEKTYQQLLSLKRE